MANGRKCIQQDRFHLLILPRMTKHIKRSGTPVICTGFSLSSALVAAILLLLLLLLVPPLVLAVGGQYYYSFYNYQYYN
jgi:hypothetical protein